MKWLTVNKILISLIIFMSLFTTGCWDKLELEELGYVIAVGIDKTEEKDTFIVTYQLSNPQGGSGSPTSKNESEPVDEIITMKLPDILTGRDTASSNVARKLTFAHLRYIIVSEELAKDELFFKQIDSLARDPEIKRKSIMIITREKANEFMKSKKSSVTSRPHKYYELMIGRLEELGLIANSTIGEYLEKTESDEGLFLAIYGTTEKFRTIEGNEDEYIAGDIPLESDTSTQIMGSAVFKEGKMIGVLNGEETKLSQLLRSNFVSNGIYATYPDPIEKDYKIISRIEKREKTKIDMDLSTNIPKINVEFTSLIHIVGIQSNINYVTDDDNRKLLKESIEKGLTKKFDDLIKKTLYDFKAQPFEWGYIARGKFLTVPQYVNYDWMKSYPGSEINIKINVILSGFGRQLQPPNIKRIED